ncbi:Ancylostoma secreted protein [Toxocara canis]|uniref:Ancylostoma secreted protein n=1 Tax=Toxocara canis TaxID=6265 RepID=A0A0B2V5A6_TOXCA|nr:Ancylostoma secreted protein [Toxocara canis]
MTYRSICSMTDLNATWLQELYNCFCKTKLAEKLSNIGYAQDCNNMALSPAIRSAIVTQHNQLRSSLAKGLEPTVRGENAPSGKNIYKLSYDCKLEAQAQKWSNECTFQHSNIALRNASENLFWAWGNDISAGIELNNSIRGKKPKRSENFDMAQKNALEDISARTPDKQRASHKTQLNAAVQILTTIKVLLLMITEVLWHLQQNYTS